MLERHTLNYTEELERHTLNDTEELERHTLNYTEELQRHTLNYTEELQRHTLNYTEELQRHTLNYTEELQRHTSAIPRAHLGDTVAVCEIFCKAKNSPCGSAAGNFSRNTSLGVPRLAKTGMLVFLFYC